MMAKGPVLFEIDADDEPVSPVSEPPVPEPEGQAMQVVTQIAARRPSRLARWFWGALLALIGAMISLAAWDFVLGLIARSPVLGWGFAALFAVLILIAIIILLRELAALARLGRVDRLRQAAEEATTLEKARDVCAGVQRFLEGRAETNWGRENFSERRNDAFDPPALFALAEDTMLAPLDRAARAEVEAAARQVATVTALVPLAMADVIAALIANVRMIRRIGQVYGGRSGFWASWRLIRAVVAHLAVTGAIAAGDEVLDHVLGGSVLSKLSRRFGEGLVNGALTARVGDAAMELCRPLPFGAEHRPSVRALVSRALRGIVSSNV
jgi:putative membrane protein